MSKQKCLLIDSRNRTVTEATYSSLDDLQKLVGGSIEAAYRWDNDDVLYVDEEGMLKGPTTYFSIPERPDQVLCGNGVLVGREDEGPQYEQGFATLDPTMTVDELRGIVRWGI